jgi:hypothetical protein
MESAAAREWGIKRVVVAWGSKVRWTIARILTTPFTDLAERKQAGLDTSLLERTPVFERALALGRAVVHDLVLERHPCAPTARNNMEASQLITQNKGNWKRDVNRIFLAWQPAHASGRQQDDKLHGGVTSRSHRCWTGTAESVPRVRGCQSTSA